MNVREWQGHLDLKDSENKRALCSEEKQGPRQGGNSSHPTPAKLLSLFRVDRGLGGGPGPGEQRLVN